MEIAATTRMYAMPRSELVRYLMEQGVILPEKFEIIIQTMCVGSSQSENAQKSRMETSSYIHLGVLLRVHERTFSLLRSETMDSKYDSIR